MCREMYTLRLKSGLSVELPCRKCTQCRAYRVSNWVGKCLAESKTARSVDYVTLSYCERDSRHAGKIADPVPVGYSRELHYEDVQKYIKRIRKAGYKVRYVVAGEYGDLKGRAHWHILLFWQGPRPERVIDDYSLKGQNAIYGNMWRDQFWHHGHVNYQPFHEGAARYVCKYLLKWDSDKDPNRKTKFRFSSRPGIGFTWLVDVWCEQHLTQQLAPQSSVYTMPDATWKGRPIRFRMSQHAQTKFVLEFEKRWKERFGRHSPPSEWVDKILDKQARPGVLDALELRQYCKAPDQATPNGEPVHFDEKLNSYYFKWGERKAKKGEVYEPGPFECFRFFWSFNEKGERAWFRFLSAPSSAASLREQWKAGSSERYREASQARPLSRAELRRRESLHPPGLRVPA